MNIWNPLIDKRNSTTIQEYPEVKIQQKTKKRLIEMTFAFVIMDKNPRNVA
jgi:hypothetical protein